MSFKFNFAAPDDSDSDSEPEIETNTAADDDDAAVYVPSLPATLHNLATLLPTLPQNISYTIISAGRTLIPRRELYDVRMQLMSEDDDPSSTTTLTERVAAIGLGDEDIRTRVYEGGLKSWECSLDLAAYLSEAATVLPASVAELGCGTALPSLVLLQRLLAANKPGRLVLADYNIDVLRLVTLPNLLLVWAVATGAAARAVVVEGESVADADTIEMVEGARADLFASDELRAEFAADLENRGIVLEFVSGAWGAEMLALLGAESLELVLGSETIYSPDTTPDFTDVLLGALAKNGEGLVAAKRIYFGVGGSVEDFSIGVEKRGQGWKVETARDVVEVGVGRCIVRVDRKEETSS